MSRTSRASLRTTLLILLASLCTLAPLISGVRPSAPVGAPSPTATGVGPHPTPPTALGTLGVLRVATLVTVSASSSTGPWLVNVSDAFGMLVAAGVTDGGGSIVVNLPTLPGLRLDVIGTDAVDVPVFAGHDVEIWIP